MKRVINLFGELYGLLRSSVNTIKTDGFGGFFRELIHQPYGRRLMYLFLSLRHKTVERMVMGSKMELDISRGYYGGVQKTLYIFGWYEPQCTKVFRSEIKEGMTVVDIGANIGYYAMMEAQLVGDSGMVYAIEPAPGNVEMLRKNVAANKYENVEIHHMAVGDTVGEGKLHLSISPNLHNMLGIHDEHGPRSSYTDVITVPTTTLDSFLEERRYPDWVRMDVEGYEYFIINGMKNILSQNKNLGVYMEIHPQDIEFAGHKIEEMLSVLFDAGLKPKYLVKRNTQHMWQNPNSSAIDIDSYRFSGSLEELTAAIDNADGLFFQRIVS